MKTTGPIWWTKLHQLLIALYGVISVMGASAADLPPLATTPKELLEGKAAAAVKIAFIGDQGLGANSKAILEMIQREQVAAIIHLGDFDYTQVIKPGSKKRNYSGPALWERQINSVFAPDFPYLAVMGNHDVDAWCDHGSNIGYARRLRERLQRAGVATTGLVGTQYSATIQGIHFALVSPGEHQVPCGGTEKDDATFLREDLSADRSIWRVAGWHRNMHAMQTGEKGDDTGWAVYETARALGAIVATGHEHAYARSELLEKIADPPKVVGTGSPLTIDEGHTIVILDGLGGREVRPQRTAGSWWARVYASQCLKAQAHCTAGKQGGALFVTFNVQGDPRRAEFYFKTLDGPDADTKEDEIDRFELSSAVNTPTPLVAPSAAVAPVVAAGAATSFANDPGLQAEYAVRWLVDSGPKTIEDVQNLLGVSGDDRDAFTVQYFGVTPPATAPAGVTSILRQRDRTSKKKFELMFKYRGSARFDVGDDACPLKAVNNQKLESPKRESDVSIGKNGTVIEAYSFSCKVESKDPINVPAELAPLPKGSPASMTRWKSKGDPNSMALTIEQWALPGNRVAIEVSGGGVHTPVDLERFMATVVRPLLAQGARPESRSMTQLASESP